MKFKWVCHNDGYVYEDSERDFGRTFDSQEDAYEDMRNAAVTKLLWNTEWEDVTTDCCPYEENGIVKTGGHLNCKGGEIGKDNWAIGYRVEFHPHMIQHHSYSGLYTYTIEIINN